MEAEDLDTIPQRSVKLHELFIDRKIYYYKKQY